MRVLAFPFTDRSREVFSSILVASVGKMYHTGLCFSSRRQSDIHEIPCQYAR